MVTLLILEVFNNIYVTSFKESSIQFFVLFFYKVLCYSKVLNDKRLILAFATKIRFIADASNYTAYQKLQLPLLKAALVFTASLISTAEYILFSYEYEFQI